ncbi:MAG: serine hydrolase domain-containing protein [Polymorphobacter sp.]
MRLHQMMTAALALGIAGCGSGGSAPAAPPTATPAPTPTPTPAPTPTPTPTPATDFTAVEARIRAFRVNNVAVMIGDADGVLYRFQRGSMTTNRAVFVASASKLFVGATIWRLIEAGRLARTTRPQEYLGFWARDAADPRSRITMDDLAGFTSGFNATGQDASCIGSAVVSLNDCVRQIHDGGTDTPPGSAFSYGAEHLQIAALLAAQREGKLFDTVMRERVAEPLGMSAETRFSLGAGDNPTYAGGMRSTAEDYARLLQALLKGGFIIDRTGFLEDRIGSRTIAYRPPGISENRLDWHYGFGFWKECDLPAYAAACDTAPVLSSPGAFGFTPWVDFTKRYWAVIAVEEGFGQGFDPASVSVELEQALQPLIETALRR